MFNYAGKVSIVSVQQKEDTPSCVQVRIWQLPSTRPSRRGPQCRPNQDRFLRRSPCQPSHLNENVICFVKQQSQITRPEQGVYSILPFFRALSMSFSISRACLFPGSFFRRVRMYFSAFSYSWSKNKRRERQKYNRNLKQI